MADTRGYWDVHRCAWVDATPTYVVPPGPSDRALPPSRQEEPPVPAQRPVVDVAEAAAAPD